MDKFLGIPDSNVPPKKMKTHIDGQGLNVSAAQSKSLIQQKKN